MSVTRVLRIRLPRDRSFLYLRARHDGRWRFSLYARVIRRRYYSTKRVELMTFRKSPVDGIAGGIR